jgi:hypothetical protein
MDMNADSKEIISLAIAHGARWKHYTIVNRKFTKDDQPCSSSFVFSFDELLEFALTIISKKNNEAIKAVQNERRECAKICGKIADAHNVIEANVAMQCYKTIRARGC